MARRQRPQRGLRGLLVVPAALVASGCAAPSPQELVPALDAPPSTRDALPTIEGEVLFEGAVADSARYLGQTDTARYWVALDEHEQVCIVQALRADAEDPPGGGGVLRTGGALRRGRCVGADQHSERIGHGARPAHRLRPRRRRAGGGLGPGRREPGCSGR
ncbi:hypothetical protein MO973_15780 [Paenibacillus sp. TRM 82003]|nr:hypothetical protein [Paenibacillus sp. TRM 82003]